MIYKLHLIPLSFFLNISTQFDKLLLWNQYKYTAGHIIIVPAGNGQAGRAPDSEPQRHEFES